MSSRPSSYLDERRPLAMVDTDTTDYYDEAGGLPPPHRLSGLYNNAAYAGSSPYAINALPTSTNTSPSKAYGAPVRNNFITAPDSNYWQQLHREHMASMSDHYDGYQTRPVYGGNRSGSQLPPAESFSGKMAYDMEPKDMDQEAFLHDVPRNNGGTAAMSAPLAARERYMARKEANSSAYAFGSAGGATAANRYNGTPSGSGRRGCFSGKRKWAWLVGGVVLVAVIAGIAIGVSQARKKSASRNGVAGVVQSNGNDPSQFTKDPRLHNSFYGMCYTPLNSQYPACGDTLSAVIEDVQLMSQLTTRLRLYGADCDVSNLVLDAIQQTKVNMTVYLAAWVPQVADDPTGATWTRQMNEVVAAVQKYNGVNIEGITVGNEFLLNGGAESVILDRVSQMKTAITALNLPNTIPIGTADAGSMITETLGAGCDYVMANVHAWFGGLPVNQAAGWVYEYTSTNAPATALQAPNNPKLFIAEEGWPTAANATQFATYEGAVAGVAELNEYMATYTCQANANITAGGLYSSYFHFEAFDEPWKEIYGGVEPYWGLFNANKTLKEGLVIPDCAHP